ncbi:hypothetical protein H4R34_001403 [Dimargaris verticillata]|uniref:Uncharacterized protein n=1 Tax=Dimargaris verticillata TaxID=2761393 RepID=A0A9W8B4S6_9FUNG|nr:hypothetical protein H4R34_001403 [Dimargaris verticillata]
MNVLSVTLLAVTMATLALASQKPTDKPIRGLAEILNTPADSIPVKRSNGQWVQVKIKK